MVPASAIGVAAFFLFVAPGTCYELLRSRVLLPTEESTFIHISRIVLSGLLLTTSTALLLTVVKFISPNALLDVPQLLTKGTAYVATNTWVTAKTFALQLFISAMLAAIVNDLRVSTKSVRIHRGTALLGLSELERPDGTQPYYCVRLKSGREVFGYYYGATTDLDPTKREIVLQPPLKIADSEQDTEAKLAPSHWQRMVIFGGEVEHVSIAYVDTHVVPHKKLSRIEKVKGWTFANYLRTKVCAPVALVLLALALIP